MSDEIKTDKSLIAKVEKLSGDNNSLAEIIDEKSYESPAVPYQNLPAIMADLDVPSHNKGPFSDIDKQRWLVVVENLLVRGVKSGREVSRLTGLSAPTACGFVNNVKEALSKDITIGRINTTRELLYSENETIADFCWNIIRTDPLDNKVPQLLKIIGDTNSRRARLMGLESVGLNVSKVDESQTYDPEKSQKLIAEKLGINALDLKNIADGLASKMNVIDINSTKKEGNDEDDKS
jgi:hypothetical protein